MKFIIKRAELLNGLNKVSKGVNSKTPLLALTGIKFTLNESYLELIGSDSDLSIRYVIPNVKNNETIIQTEEYGSIVIDEKFICEVIRKIESDVVEISVVDNIAKIKSNKSVFNYNCIPAIDYPEISFADNSEVSSFLLDALELKNLFDQTLFATADKEARPTLTGLNFKCDGNILEVVATDTFRLTKKVIVLPSEFHFNVTIPHDSLDNINKIIELGQSINISISEKKVTFETNDCMINTRVISGTYPDTSRLIPVEYTQILKISTKELLGAIERAAIILTEKYNVVKLNMKKDDAYVSSKSAEKGFVVEKLNEFFYEGDDLTISFSAKYLLDAIRALASDEIILQFTGDMKPLIMKSDSNPSLIELILPMRSYN